MNQICAKVVLRSIDFQRCTPSRNHARRMSHTTSTITITVPTKPIPNISPPSRLIGHQGYPYSHDRPDSGCRLIKTGQYHGSSKWDLRSVRSPTCCACVTGNPEVIFPKLSAYGWVAGPSGWGVGGIIYLVNILAFRGA